MEIIETNILNPDLTEKIPSNEIAPSEVVLNKMISNDVVFEDLGLKQSNLECLLNKSIFNYSSIELPINIITKFNFENVLIITDNSEYYSQFNIDSKIVDNIEALNILDNFSYNFILFDR